MGQFQGCKGAGVGVACVIWHSVHKWTVSPVMPGHQTGSCQCLHPHYARVPSWSSAKIASQYTLGTITQDLQRTQPSNNDSSELLLKNGTSRESLSIVVGHPCFRNCTTGAELGLFQSAVGFVLQIQASLGAVETTPPTLISQSLPNRAGPSPFTTCRVS